MLQQGAPVLLAVKVHASLAGPGALGLGRTCQPGWAVRDRIWDMAARCSRGFWGPVGYSVY